VPKSGTEVWRAVPFACFGRNLYTRLSLRFGTLVKTLSFIALLALSSWIAPVALCAAQPGKVYRIGYLSLPPVADTPSGARAAFLRALEKLGYVHGKNLIIEYRSGEGNVELLLEAALDLLDQKPAVIFAPGAPAALAAK